MSQLVGCRLLVCHDQRRRWTRFPVLQERLTDALAHLAVHSGERLVEQDEIRWTDDRACERDAPALSSGELRRTLIQAVADAESIRDAFDVLASFFSSDSGAAQRELEMLARAQMRIQRIVLEDDAEIPLVRAHGSEIASGECDRA